MFWEDFKLWLQVHRIQLTATVAEPARLCLRTLKSLPTRSPGAMIAALSCTPLELTLLQGRGSRDFLCQPEANAHIWWVFHHGSPGVCSAGSTCSTV